MRSLRTTLLAAAVVLGAAVPAMPAAPAAAADDGGDGFTIKDPRITESSGLAASRAHPGVYWTHNDQDEPRVFAVDSRTGKTVATVTLRGVGTPRDMEAISIGPDGYVYVGDIGDNADSWDHVWIYRFPEPRSLKDVTVLATQYVVKYEGGPRNAEAMMVHPKTGRVYIASKNEDGGGLYEGPARLVTGGTNTFRRIGEVPWVTDGAFSPDGKQLVLRSYFSARGYAWKGGRLGDDHQISAPLQGQSESVTYTPDGKALMFGTEGAQSEVVRRKLGKEEQESPGGDSPAASASGGGSGGASAPEGGSGAGSSLAGPAGAVIAAAVLALAVRSRRRGRGGQEG
ncbi:esterase-like activity of phytase family protein [Streptomyces formicae]|uniref:WD40 repeat domain-containing protein n=1 Tax=Streptomyces formicae TaxID=1616117 RepID=A0ABY3WT55_9ACTN|nr:esterase-like activity of phytase family protein [Streptomyces formicae]UNM15838.1 WD40 repeat domain-containing protein [Streptomyces formicae]